MSVADLHNLNFNTGKIFHKNFIVNTGNILYNKIENNIFNRGICVCSLPATNSTCAESSAKMK